MVLAVLDGLVLIPVQPFQRPRQGALVALVGGLGQRARLPFQGGEVERLRLAEPAQPDLGPLRGTGRQCGQTEGGQGGGGIAEEVATLHAGSGGRNGPAIIGRPALIR